MWTVIAYYVVACDGVSQTFRLTVERVEKEIWDEDNCRRRIRRCSKRTHNRFAHQSLTPFCIVSYRKIIASFSSPDLRSDSFERQRSFFLLFSCLEHYGAHHRRILSSIQCAQHERILFFNFVSSEVWVELVWVGKGGGEEGKNVCEREKSEFLVNHVKSTVNWNWVDRHARHLIRFHPLERSSSSTTERRDGEWSEVESAEWTSVHTSETATN